MAFQTKQNLNINKFIQCSADNLKLSGCTEIYGSFLMKNLSSSDIIFNKNGTLTGNTNLRYYPNINAFKFGQFSVVSGQSSVAIAGGASCAINSVAMICGITCGDDSAAIVGGTTYGVCSVALANGITCGYGSVALSNGTSVGSYSTAMSCGISYGQYSIALSNGEACGNYSIAAICSISCGNESVAIGHSGAIGANSLAIGYGNAIGDSSIALINSSALGCRSIAMAGGSAYGYGSIALGNSSVYGCRSIALGANSCNFSINALTFGYVNLLDSGNTNSVLLGGSGITIGVNCHQDTVIVPNLAIYCTPSGSGNILCWNSTTKKVGLTSGGGTGGTTIVSSPDQIIFNNAGTLTGNTNLKYCKAKDSFKIGAFSCACGCNSFAINDGIAHGYGSIAFGGSFVTGVNSFGSGVDNTISGCDSTIIGGVVSTISSNCSGILGGELHNICTGNNYSGIIGGYRNRLCSGNTNSVILGGCCINATANTYSCTVIVPNLAIWCTPTGSGNTLCWNSTTKKVELTLGAIPAGSNMQMQYNNNGSFGAVPLQYDNTLCSFSMYSTPTACTTIFHIQERGDLSYNTQYYIHSFCYNNNNTTDFPSYYIKNQAGTLTLGINKIVGSPRWFAPFGSLAIGNTGTTGIYNSVFTQVENSSVFDYYKLCNGRSDLSKYNGEGVQAGVSKYNIIGLLGETAGVQTVELLRGGDLNRIVLRDGIHYFKIILQGVWQNNLGSLNSCLSAVCKIEGAIRKYSSTVQFVGSPVCTTIGQTVAGCFTFAISADASNCALGISGTSNITGCNALLTANVELSSIETSN